MKSSITIVVNEFEPEGPQPDKEVPCYCESCARRLRPSYHVYAYAGWRREQAWGQDRAALIAYCLERLDITDRVK